MKIKYNNFLIITPIFFAIAFVISLLNYSNEKNEIMWGVKEEVTSIGLASSIFIDKMIRDKSIVELEDKLLMHFNRIKRYKQAQRFYIIKNEKILIDTSQEEKKFKAQNIKEFKDKDFILSEIYEKKDLSLIDIYVPIKKDNEIEAILSVEVDISNATKDLREAKVEMIFTIILITLTGIFISILLSNIVTKKINSLSRVANSIAMGNYSENINVGSIKEFSDLGDILNTMKSIMQEILFKTKNSIIEEEEFRSEDDILKTYSELFVTSKNYIDEKVEISIQKIGDMDVDYFFNIVSNKDTIFCFFGKLKFKNKSLNSAIEASSFNHFLSKKLISENINCLDSAIKIFPIEELNLIKIDKKVMFYQYEKSKLMEDELDLNNETIFFHTFNKKIEYDIDVYMENYKFLTLKELSLDLKELLSDKENGLLVLLNIKDSEVSK